MNASQILQLVAQGLALLPTLIATGVNVVQRIEQIKELADAGASGTATDEQIATVRSQLDADLAEFNKPIDDQPPAA